MQRDVDEGDVTAIGAREDYGCVVGANGRIDRTASAARRAARMKVREPPD